MIDSAATSYLQDIADLERRIAVQREVVRKLTALGWRNASKTAIADLDLMVRSLSRLRDGAQAYGLALSDASSE